MSAETIPAVQPEPIDEPTSTDIYVWVYRFEGGNGQVFALTSSPISGGDAKDHALAYPPMQTTERRLIKVTVPHNLLRPTP